MRKMYYYLGMLLLFLVFSCDNDDSSVISNPEGSKVTSEGIDFIYQLLDKDGNPSVRFKSGDPFSFRFFMKSNRPDSISYAGGSFSCELNNDGFANVITQDKGVLPTRIFCTDILHYCPLYGDDFLESIVPLRWWNDSKETEEMSLSSGKYRTELEHTFRFFDKDGQPFTVGPLSLVINFEVE